jgi:hypothetical protein
MKSALVLFLAMSLTVSPLMAQNAQTTSSSTVETEGDNLAQPKESSLPANRDTTVAAPSRLAGILMPPEWRVPPVNAAYNHLPLRSTVPFPVTHWDDDSRATGRTKWIYLAALAGAGIVVATILLWPHGNKSGSSDPAGTVIVAGTGSVGTPPR